MVNELTQEAELDRVYLGKVKRITDFGAFVEIFPGTDGLIHISHLAEGRVEKVTDVVSEGDEVLAKCIEIDPVGPDPALAQGGAGGRRGGGVLDLPGHGDLGAPVTVRITRLPGARGLPLPARATAGSAGFDLHAALERELVLEPGERALVPTGFAIAVPEGYEAQVRPRSGLALRHGLVLPNAPGTIDADYRGELSRDRDERGPRADHAAARRSDRAAGDRAGRERALRRGREPRRDGARRRRVRPHRRGAQRARRATRRRGASHERAVPRRRARAGAPAAAHAAAERRAAASAASPTSRRACSPRRS